MLKLGVKLLLLVNIKILLEMLFKEYTLNRGGGLVKTRTVVMIVVAKIRVALLFLLLLDLLLDLLSDVLYLVSDSLRLEWWVLC